MKNLWTTIAVSNLEASLVFYTEVLKLPIDRQMKTPNGIEIIFLGEGETKFELIYNPHQGTVTYGTGVSTGFEVQSVEAMMTQFEEMGMTFEGPFEPAPFIKFIYVKDPDGYKIQLVEHL